MQKFILKCYINILTHLVLIREQACLFFLRVSSCVQFGIVKFGDETLSIFSGHFVLTF